MEPYAAGAAVITLTEYPALSCGTLPHYAENRLLIMLKGFFPPSAEAVFLPCKLQGEKVPDGKRKKSRQLTGIRRAAFNKKACGKCGSYENIRKKTTVIPEEEFSMLSVMTAFTGCPQKAEYGSAFMRAAGQPFFLPIIYLPASFCVRLKKIFIYGIVRSVYEPAHYRSDNAYRTVLQS